MTSTHPLALSLAVIRYDLEFLGLCPCMVDVEIIDAKAGNASVIVSAGPEACACQNKVRSSSSIYPACQEVSGESTVVPCNGPPL